MLCAGLEIILRGPCLEHRFLHQVVGKVGASAQAARERAQVRNDFDEFLAEIEVGRRSARG